RSSVATHRDLHSFPTRRSSDLNLLLCFVRNDGAPQRSMAAMIGGSLSNVVLDYVFMFPLGMGIFGAVFATGLAPVISMGILSTRSEEHTSELQSRFDLVCRLLL